MADDRPPPLIRLPVLCDGAPVRACIAILIAAWLVLPAAAHADDAAVLYDPSDVALVDLTLSEEAEQALLEEPKEYVDATFALELGDSSFGPGPVEVKLKGTTSFLPLTKKAAFKVKFPKANRLLGLKSMTLNNMIQDRSMAHETLGYEILRAAGVPAPRTGFAYVRVNGARYGLYLNLETYDDISMARLFGSTRHLFEADAYDVDVTPGSASAYEVEEGDDDDVSDLEALIDAANATGGDWSDGMGATADLDEMARMWAGEQFLGNWDGYSVRTSEFQPNNYYLHSDAIGRFSMLPSGLDRTFEDRDPFPGTSDARLITGCLADASCLALFRERLDDVATAADAIGAGKRLERIAETVARWRPCEDRFHASDAAWQTAVTQTRAFIRERRKDVAAYRGAAAPAKVPALESTAAPQLSRAGCPLDPPVQKPADPGPSGWAGRGQAPAASVQVLGDTAARVRPRRLTARTRLTRGRRLTTSGALLLPAGVGRAGTCGGRVTIRVKSGRRTLATRRVALRYDCSYSATFKLETRRRLSVQARFGGTGALLATRTVTTRPRA
jgi:hypothetical protein